MGTRRQSRELALQVLFQEEFHSQLNVEQSLALYRDSFDSSPEIWEYAKSLVHGVRKHSKEIDELIQSYSKHWKLDRMPKVDLNILRLASFELKYMEDEIPPKVAINEAIELGKKFSSEDSASFLNGILDNISKAT